METGTLAMLPFHRYHTDSLAEEGIRLQNNTALKIQQDLGKRTKKITKYPKA